MNSSFIAETVSSNSVDLAILERFQTIMFVRIILSILAEDDVNLDMINETANVSASDDEFDDELQMIERQQRERTISSDSDFNERIFLLELEDNDELAHEIELELERDLLDDLSDFSIDRELEIAEELRYSPSSSSEDGSSSGDMDDPSRTDSNRTDLFEENDFDGSFDDSDDGDSSTDDEEDFIFTKNDHVLFL